ncbi:hypothetical protein PAMC26510_03850 [Caballeronia sordidicola]|uniref:Uncharacterized protein n=1 Tax=Caballeronia sordidicola TaxID=196367 RepID=A0A242N935_CABSO|nr:hypothetical protein PAMC26510_03850 [Caballeronia sordidicola]
MAEICRFTDFSESFNREGYSLKLFFVMPNRPRVFSGLAGVKCILYV